HFDHLYECVQNAVDTCERSFQAAGKASGDVSVLRYTPELQVEIDLCSNTLTVVDNGEGMTKDVLERYYFTPHATLKSLFEAPGDEVRQRGEKGVGATFLSYGSNFIHISTRDANSGAISSGELTDAR